MPDEVAAVEQTQPPAQFAGFPTAVIWIELLVAILLKQEFCNC
jgi:hypothetical protein